MVPKSRRIGTIASKKEIEAQLKLAQQKYDAIKPNSFEDIKKREYYYGVYIALHWARGLSLHKPVKDEI